MRTSVARRPREDDISHSRKKLVNSDGIESDTSFSYNLKHRDAFWFSSRVLVFFLSMVFGLSFLKFESE